MDIKEFTQGLKGYQRDFFDDDGNKISMGDFIELNYNRKMYRRNALKMMFVCALRN